MTGIDFFSFYFVFVFVFAVVFVVVFVFDYFSHRVLVGLGNGILTSSVYIVEVVSADNRGSVVMVSYISARCL